jgi:hypothetical protein
LDRPKNLGTIRICVQFRPPNWLIFNASRCNSISGHYGDVPLENMLAFIDEAEAQPGAPS